MIFTCTCTPKPRSLCLLSFNWYAEICILAYRNMYIGISKHVYWYIETCILVYRNKRYINAISLCKGKVGVFFKKKKGQKKKQNKTKYL